MRTLSVLLAIVVLASWGRAQEPRQGPVTPPPKREVKRIPVGSDAEPLPMPAEEIVRRFAEKEEELKRAHENSTYRMTVRVQEFEEDGSAGGEWQVVSEIVFKPDGSRVGRIVQQVPSTLKRFTFSVEDLEDLVSLPQFILTPDQLSRYAITYQGTQPLDELKTYIFRVQPQRLERRVRQFEGLVWVDDRDLVIVKSYGRMVTEVSEDAAELPFKLYETYREHIGGPYWFPSYTRSEEVIKSESGEARLRLTIRSSDFKLREQSK